MGVPGKIMFKKIFLLRVFLFLFVSLFAWSVSRADAISVSHDIRISLYPAEKRLAGVDQMSIEPEGKPFLAFLLSKKAKIIDVKVNNQKRDFHFKKGILSLGLKENEKNGTVLVSIKYEGIFDDDVPVLPVNTDNPGYGVIGSISEKGAFLLAGAGWYPEIPESYANYLLRIEAPEGMIAVTAGKSFGHQTKGGKTLSFWDVRHPVEGLSLSAARYTVREKVIGRVKIATYFFQKSRDLAEPYLEATERYIKLYENLFGPYPFDKFAVVENFFPTGYGFPSYTLLGSRVLRLPFIIHTSLGHEVAHSWWGNGVYVDMKEGNWSEGLTTYIADYLYKERASEKEAREYRLQTLRSFAALVNPENDFALKEFLSRTDPATGAIGYGKGAMVFHMLRKLIGEEAFWGGLRDVYRDRLFQKASWRDFQEAFERRSGRSLKKFFGQWVSQKGSPELLLKHVFAKKKGDRFEIQGKIIQKPPFYELELPLLLEARGEKIVEKLTVSGEITPFEIESGSPPNRLAVDPGFDIFRHLYSSEIPPSINSLKGASSVLIVLGEDRAPWLKDAARTLALSLGLMRYKILKEEGLQEKELDTNDILLIGLPKNRFLLSRLPENIVLEDRGFIINKKTYNRPQDAFFGVFEHPFIKNRVAAIFLPLSQDHADAVVRKVTHYGKYSYLAFSKGKNQDKGIWPVTDSPLIYSWGRKK